MKFFLSEGCAEEWMYKQVNDSCVDNYRFAYYGDKKAEEKYVEQYEDGCCGSFDEDVYILFRKAKIGCNYGH